MTDVVELNLWQFGLVYLLLLVVLAVMKKSRISQTKLLIVASVRMTVQLVLAGLILTYILKNPHPIFTILYLAAMTAFAVHRVLSRNRTLSRRFKLIVAASLAGAGLLIVIFFILVVVGVNLFNSQYTIPVSGMIIGNAMTGVSLGLKSFTEALDTQRGRIAVLLNIGAEPKHILHPFVNSALETALLPTLNSMLGLGIISLPGMMTGQILSGTPPLTAILYQISIMVAICAVVCLAVFCALNLGYRTLWNKRQQILV